MRKRVDIVLKRDEREKRKHDNVYHQIMDVGSCFVAESTGCAGVPMIVYVLDPSMPIEVNCWAVERFTGGDGKYNYGRIFKVLEMYADKFDGKDVIMVGDREESIILHGCVRIIASDEYHDDFPKKLPNISYAFKIEYCKDVCREFFVDVVTVREDTFGATSQVNSYRPFVDSMGYIKLHNIKSDEQVPNNRKGKPAWSDMAMEYVKDLDDSTFVPYPLNVLRAYDQGFEDSKIKSN